MFLLKALTILLYLQSAVQSQIFFRNTDRFCNTTLSYHDPLKNYEDLTLVPHGPKAKVNLQEDTSFHVAKLCKNDEEVTLSRKHKAKRNAHYNLDKFNYEGQALEKI